MKKEWFEDPKVIAAPIVLCSVMVLAYLLSQWMLVQCLSYNIAGIELRTGCAQVNLTNLYSRGSDPFDKEGILARDAEQKDIKSRKTLAERYGGRFSWMFTYIANLLCAIAVWLICFLSIKKWTSRDKAGDAPDPGSGSDGWIAALVFGAVSCALGLIIVLSDYMPAMRSVFMGTIADGSPQLTAGLPGILGFEHTVNGFTYAGSAIFVIAMAVLVFPRRSERLKDVERDGKGKAAASQKNRVEKAIAVMSEKKESLRILLYAATLLLVVSVARTNVTFSWMMTFMAPETLEGVKLFHSSFSTVLGGFYTLLLATSYLPAAFIIYERGKNAESLLPKKAAASTGEETKAAAKPEAKSKAPESAFSFSFMDALPRILAIIAPFIAGPIADMLKNLGPK